MSKYKEIAVNVLEQIGGKENVSNIFHCMTRLRFNLKDNGLVNEEAIKSINGVLGLHVDNGEIQIIIGPAVENVYNEMLKLTGIDRTAMIEENLDSKKEFSVKVFFADVINSISACMNPLVPVFVLLGMINVIAALIGPQFLNLVTTDSNIYTNFYNVGQAIIYFLPVLIAVTASKKFKCNTYISLVLAGILLYPNFAELLNTGTYTVFGIPAPAVAYSGSVIPIMLIVFAQGYVEKFINKMISDVVKVLLVPLLTVLVMLPIALCVLGPLGQYIGIGLAGAIMWLRQVAGPVETMLVAAFVPFMTAFGIGRPLFFVCLTTLLTTGSEFAYMPIAMVINNWLAMGVAIGFFLKSKNANNKQLGLTCFAANFLGGVSEPTLFGILLPNKKTYLPVIIGGGLAGLYLGFMNVGLYQFGASNFLNVMAFIGGDANNFLHGCIASGIAFVVTAALTFIMYKDEQQA